MATLTLLIPALLLVALAVRITSRGPVLFLQSRVGRFGRPFTILKFRTLDHRPNDSPGAPRFTILGRWLRGWKLDELPQLFNVLTGAMSLVGPRPKLAEYEPRIPLCRPGITGAATLMFAREDELLEQFPRLRSRETYRTVVMPAKCRHDDRYMAEATFFSDLKLLIDTLFHRWETGAVQDLVSAPSMEACASMPRLPAAAHRPPPRFQGPLLPRMNVITAAEAGANR